MKDRKKMWLTDTEAELINSLRLEARKTKVRQQYDERPDCKYPDCFQKASPDSAKKGYCGNHYNMLTRDHSTAVGFRNRRRIVETLDES